MKILVPTDFSLESRYAAEFACQLSQLTQVEINLLHIVEIPAMVIADPTGYTTPIAYDEAFVDNLIKQGEQKLNEFAQAYAKCGVKHKVKVGNTYSSIVDWAKTHNADLIVMGTKGASGMKEFLVGSNAQKIVRRSPCPVLTLAERKDATQIKNVVYATNNSEHSDYLLKGLCGLQTLFNATIHMVRINTPNHFKADGSTLEILEKVAQHYKLQDYTVNTYNEEHEVKGIVAFAESKKADLIALGTHGREGLSRFLSGSLTEDLINHTQLPVWSCHFKSAKKHK